MRFYADLHVHSKYSRATSRNCDLEHMAGWARKKGVTVLGTGDFTHPGWFREIQEKLVPAEPGLFKLKPELETQIDHWTDVPGHQPVRFMLEVEISTIYKKDGKTRKVHHLIYAPDFEQAQQISSALARIGNINSDGRPILGLDSRDLLEIALEAGDSCYLIPAHIWTPWFAVLGSKSGFDCIEHCYGDLADHIFALETGLSSDPAMNWRLSALDRYTLVSNSDAHSPGKIGREACAFYTDLSYFAIRRALETGQGYSGTLEFFPEEGKYHLDGHRKCRVCLEPDETRSRHGLCPVCGKSLTLGVMHRVHELADRSNAQRPPSGRPYRCLVPLDEVLSEIDRVGAKSKTVQTHYDHLISRLGPELFILEGAPLDDVCQAAGPLVAQALARMRRGQVIRQGGYDGEYGRIRLFTQDELRTRTAASLLFDRSEDEHDSDRLSHLCAVETDAGHDSAITTERSKPGLHRTTEDQRPPPRYPLGVSSPVAPPTDFLDGLDHDQRVAAQTTHGPLVIIAGPGTGKTRVVTHRMAHLIAVHGVKPAHCLAITFTKRAAEEMSQRLDDLLVGRLDRPPVMTFHALGMSILREHGHLLGLPRTFRVASQAQCFDVLEKTLAVSRRKAGQWLRIISRTKRCGESPEPCKTGSTQVTPDAVVRIYQQRLDELGLVDFDDLIGLSIRLLKAHPDLVDHYRSVYRWLSVDEFQDVDHHQYQLIKLLVAPDGNVCVIGDPDQAIYGFRGSDATRLQQLRDDFPSAQTIQLTQNYRSTQTIVDAALQLAAPSSLMKNRCLIAQTDGPDRIEIHRCASDRAEAQWIVHAIERMIGGSSFFSIDSGRVQVHEGQDLAFADFAVLYRTDAQADTLAETLERSGIPFQKRSHCPLTDQPEGQSILEAIGHTPPDLTVLDRLNLAVEKLGQDNPNVKTYLPPLRAVAMRHARDFEAFMSELVLGVDIDLWDQRADRVSLLTLHASKGLEFPVVFITGCEDGVLPLRWGRADNTDLAEERRLFFVGMTRAKRRLLLTCARKRCWMGRIKEMEPSSFLRDIHQQLLACHDHRSATKATGQFAQMELF